MISSLFSLQILVRSKTFACEKFIIFSISSISSLKWKWSDTLSLSCVFSSPSNVSCIDENFTFCNNSLLNIEPLVVKNALYTIPILSVIFLIFSSK